MEGLYHRQHGGGWFSLNMATSETLFEQEVKTSWISSLAASAPPLTCFLIGLPTQANRETLPITNPTKMPSSWACLHLVPQTSWVFTWLLSYLLISPHCLCKHWLLSTSLFSWAHLENCQLPPNKTICCTLPALLELNIYGKEKKINLAATPVTLKSESTSLVGNQRWCSFPTVSGEDLIASFLTSSPHTHSLWHWSVSEWPHFPCHWNKRSTVLIPEWSVSTTRTPTSSGHSFCLWMVHLHPLLSPLLYRLSMTTYLNLPMLSLYFNIFLFPQPPHRCMQTHFSMAIFAFNYTHSVGRYCWFLNVPDV